MGTSAANNFSGLLTVKSDFHNPQVHFTAAGFFESEAVVVLLYYFSYLPFVLKAWSLTKVGLQLMIVFDL